MRSTIWPRIIIASVVVLLWPSWVAPAFADGLGAGYVPGPGWQPRWSMVEARGGLLTAAERSEMVRRLIAIEALFLKADALRQPRGFEVQTRLVGGGLTTRTELARYGFYLQAWRQTMKISGEGPAPIEVRVNPEHVAMAEGGGIGDQEILSEFPVGDPIPGATVVYTVGHLPDRIYKRFTATDPGKIRVLLTSGAESPWIPVSAERFMQAAISKFDDGKKAPQTPYELWMSQAAQRRNDYAATVAAIPDKAQAGKMREEFEKTEREVTASLKKSEASDRKELSQPKAVADSVRAQLAAMTPAQRAADFWSLGDLKPVPPNTPNARRIVSPKPGFYRMKRSPLEIRAILVTMNIERVDIPGSRELDHAVYEAYTKLDWAALAGMLDPAIK